MAQTDALSRRPSNGVVSAWLWTVAALVFAMIVVGGATRLTDSGLSITEWQPILGVIPPLSEADWQAALAKYRQIPQYQLVNKGMSLAEFQFIYWWEWAHRFLGRVIGVAFAVPLAWFWVRGRLSRDMGLKLLGLLALGGLQGVVGWYMVMSGLSERIDVSQYRLAVHLTLALIILGLLVWLALAVARGARTSGATHGQRRLALAMVALVLVQSFLGALVAGLNAGLTYNTWPLMDGRLVPEGLGSMQPWYLNLFENVTTVQFNHRIAAYVVTGGAIWQAVWLWRRSADARIVRSAIVVAAAMVGQAGLGIWTLLWAVPLWLGLAHQAGASVIVMLTVWHAFGVTRPQKADACNPAMRPVRA